MDGYGTGEIKELASEFARDAHDKLSEIVSVTNEDIQRLTEFALDTFACYDFFDSGAVDYAEGVIRRELKKLINNNN